MSRLPLLPEQTVAINTMTGSTGIHPQKKGKLAARRGPHNAGQCGGHTELANAFSNCPIHGVVVQLLVLFQCLMAHLMRRGVSEIGGPTDLLAIDQSSISSLG